MQPTRLWNYCLLTACAIIEETKLYTRVSISSGDVQRYLVSRAYLKQEKWRHFYFHIVLDTIEKRGDIYIEGEHS